MDWLTWFDLNKYKIASMHIRPRKSPAHGVPKRSVTVHLLHELNDYPPMEIIFELHDKAGRSVVASIKNNLSDKEKIHMSVNVARDFDNDNLKAINEVLKTLSRGE